MNKLLLLSFLTLSFAHVHAQNIDDEKVSFTYTQLPLVKIDEAYKSYEVVLDHRYEQANNDSTYLHEARQKLMLEFFQNAMANHQRTVDSLDRNYLMQMAQWEIQTNNGVKQPNGQPLVAPKQPVYPLQPIYPVLTPIFLHAPLAEAELTKNVQLQGFSEGTGEIKITLAVLPLQNIQLIERKSGTGSSTKYTYSAQYNLPIEITVETPKNGIIMKLRVQEGAESYAIGEYKSKYDYQLCMLNSKEQFMRDLERSARSKAIQGANDYLNNQIGFPVKTRYAELYAVKRFKDYDYSDVTTAFTYTIQALELVKNDRDRKSALPAIDKAIAAWNEVLFESNNYDAKARINDKVTAMIQCNLAELMMWKADFQNAELNLNLAIANGGKFKRHADDEKPFLADQKRRWEVNQ